MHRADGRPGLSVQHKHLPFASVFVGGVPQAANIANTVKRDVTCKDMVRKVEIAVFSAMFPPRGLSGGEKVIGEMRGYKKPELIWEMETARFKAKLALVWAREGAVGGLSAAFLPQR